MRIYQNQDEIISEIRELVDAGGRVELRDDRRAMLVGWGDVASHRAWQIPATTVRARKVPAFGALIATPSGRRQIAHNFNHGHPLDRELQEDCLLCVVEDVMSR